MSDPSAQTAEALALLTGVGSMIASCVMMVLQVVVTVGISWVIAAALERIPAATRTIAPGAAWLRMLGLVPCLGAPFLLVYDFWLLPATSKSLAAAWRAVGDTGRGSCGEGLAWISCILTVVASMLGVVAFGALVLALGSDPRVFELGEVSPDSPALGALAAVAISGLAASLVWLVSLVLFAIWLVKIRSAANALPPIGPSTPASAAAVPRQFTNP